MNKGAKPLAPSLLARCPIAVMPHFVRWLTSGVYTMPGLYCHQFVNQLAGLSLGQLRPVIVSEQLHQQGFHRIG